MPPHHTTTSRPKGQQPPRPKTSILQAPPRSLRTRAPAEHDLEADALVGAGDDGDFFHRECKRGDFFFGVGAGNARYCIARSKVPNRRGFRRSHKLQTVTATAKVSRLAK